MRQNNRFEILTPSGFQGFEGIVKNNKETIKILFSDDTNIVTTPNHKFVYDDIEITTSCLEIGQSLSNKVIIDIIPNGIVDVYDPINVSNGNLYLTDGLISHNCDFLGSSSTLINSDALARLSASPIIYSKDSLDVYERPMINRVYAMIVDVSKGVGGDYSAFTVIDITETPYRVVAKYKNNTISPLLFPNVIYKVGMEYNGANILIEGNVGEQVGYILYNELEYENILFINRSVTGQTITGGFGSGKSQVGIITDKKVKRIGCSSLKMLIEESKLLIPDADIISELSTFIEVKGSFAADNGYHDDLVMTLVLFGWLVTQPYFKELNNVDLRHMIYQNQIRQIEDELTPFGFYNDGQDSEVLYNF